MVLIYLFVMNDVSCLNPVYILNPSYLSYVATCDLICVDDMTILKITPEKRGKIFDGFNFWKVFNLVYLKGCGNLFPHASFVNSHTSECYPLFMKVPCGHCDACHAKRHNGIIQRLNFGFEEDTGLSLFVTLTYNDKFLPKLGVNRRDIQLFKKRLNKVVFSLYGVRLKYGYFSEYGDDERPHYHMIIYGMPFLSHLTSYGRFEFFSRLLQFCWRSFPKRGFKRAERYDFNHYLMRNYTWFGIKDTDFNKDPYSMGFVNVEFPSNGKCFGYISKYISKSSNVPKGQNKNFYNLSNNLGVSWLQSLLDNINKDTSKFLYRSKYGTKPKELYLCSYYIKKLFPSFTSLVSVEFRRKWIAFQERSFWLSSNKCLPSWIRLSALTYVETINKKFPTFCPILDFSVDNSGQEVYSYLFTSSMLNPDIYEDVFLQEYIDMYKYFLDYPSDFEEYVSEQVVKRDKFLRPYSRLTSDPLISALKFSKTYNRYQSSKKI